MTGIGLICKCMYNAYKIMTYFKTIDAYIMKKTGKTEKGKNQIWRTPPHDSSFTRIHDKKCKLHSMHSYLIFSHKEMQNLFWYCSSPRYSFNLSNWLCTMVPFEYNLSNVSVLIFRRKIMLNMIKSFLFLTWCWTKITKMNLFAIFKLH